MATTAQPPDRCPNPDCHSTGGFTLRSTRYEYDRRQQLGTINVEQIPKARVVTWECDRCQARIDVREDA